MTRSAKRTTLPLAGLLTLASTGLAQAPDAIPSVVGFDWNNYGELGGIHAYSFGTTMCNLGDVALDVDPYFETPVVGQNLFRISDGRIQQIGYGFPTVRVCALNEPNCGACQVTACSTLGIGCADSSAIHDGSAGWGKWAIDANRGEWPVIPPGPSGDPRILNGRIQVDSAVLGDPGSVYVAEAQIISGHDQQAGRGGNNLSWREVLLHPPASPINAGPTNAGQPAIFAWRAHYPDVRLVELTLVDEGGPGIDGTYWLASRFTDLGNGRWRYDYAVQNLSSEVAARGLVIEAPCGAGATSDALYHGVRHHSGSPYANDPWTFSDNGNALRWSTATFASNPDANALRWGNLFAFSVESDAPPRLGGARLLLFEQAGALQGSVWAPANVPCPGSLPPSRAGTPRRP